MNQAGSVLLGFLRGSVEGDWAPGCSGRTENAPRKFSTAGQMKEASSALVGLGCVIVNGHRVQRAFVRVRTYRYRMASEAPHEIAKVIKMRPDLTLIWRVSDAALHSREPGGFQVIRGEHTLECKSYRESASCGLSTVGPLAEGLL